MTNEISNSGTPSTSDYPIYSVIGLDLGVSETDLVIGDDHFNIIEVFHCNNPDEAMEKLKDFNLAYPKAMITNNAIIAVQFYQFKIGKLKKSLGIGDEND